MALQPCTFTTNLLLTAVTDFLLISSPLTSVIPLVNSMGRCTFSQKYCHSASPSPENFFWGSLAAAAPLLIVPAGFQGKVAYCSVGLWNVYLNISQSVSQRPMQLSSALPSLPALYTCISELSVLHDWDMGFDLENMWLMKKMGV